MTEKEKIELLKPIMGSAVRRTFAHCRQGEIVRVALRLLGTKYSSTSCSVVANRKQDSRAEF